MRIIVMFDLPVLTSNNRKEYRAFRRFLIKNGFLMEQQSVYSKLASNSAAVDSLLASIKKNKPSSGVVQILKVTENQYNKMEYIVGKRISNVVDSEERILEL